MFMSLQLSHSSFPCSQIRIDESRLSDVERVYGKIMCAIEKKCRMRFDGASGGPYERFCEQVRKLIGKLEQRIRLPHNVAENRQTVTDAEHARNGGNGTATATTSGGATNEAAVEGLVDEDLNAVDEVALQRAKGAMDVAFEKNRKKIGDNDFVYDVVVNFESHDGPGDWDSSSEEDECGDGAREDVECTGSGD